MVGIFFKEIEMPLINTYTPENAEGSVKVIYDEIISAFGSVPNALQIYSSSPAMLAEHWHNIAYYMQHPSLGFNLLAFIRLLVSDHGRCEYCVGFNEAMLINMGGISVEQIAATKQNLQNAPLPDKDKAMLAFVLKAIKTSAPATPAEITALKALGWNDGEILDGLGHGANMVAADIILNTLQIERDF
jgi:hypothetical protein